MLLNFLAIYCIIVHDVGLASVSRNLLTLNKYYGRHPYFSDDGEKMNRKLNVRFLAESAVIAALYAVLTYVAAMMNLAYGPIQFRFSEALTVLPIFTPAAVPGLAIGCFISNLASPLGIVDWVFGTLATLLAALTAQMLRKIVWKGIPWLSVLMPVIFNSLIIGFEIACLSDAGNFSLSYVSLSAFSAAAVSVGIGELVICFGLGIPLILAFKRTGTALKLFGTYKK